MTQLVKTKSCTRHILSNLMNFEQSNICTPEYKCSHCTPIPNQQPPIGNEQPPIGNEQPLRANQQPPIGNEPPLIANEQPLR